MLCQSECTCLHVSGKAQAEGTASLPYSKKSVNGSSTLVTFEVGFTALFLVVQLVGISRWSPFFEINPGTLCSVIDTSWL